MVAHTCESQLDLAIVLARLGESKEAAVWWKEVIHEEPNRILTEEQYTPLLSVFSLIGKDASYGLKHNVNQNHWQLYEWDSRAPNQIGP